MKPRKRKRKNKNNRPAVRTKTEKKDGWLIPPIWAGKTCFILGGGPSLNHVNYDLIKDRRVIAVNNSYGDPVGTVRGQKAEYTVRPWVDVVWFGDERWFWWHKNNLKDFHGLLATPQARLHRRHGILACHRGRSEGIDKNPRYVAWNKCSGSSAINLAYHFGCRVIVLLGYDMRRVDDQPNWHFDHPAPKKNPYKRFLSAFPAIARDAKRLGVQIINCTPGSAITQFPIQTLEDFLHYEITDSKSIIAPKEIFCHAEKG